MNEPERYPPPDFSCPPTSSIQLPQQPRASSFHPSMWTWGETTTETSWTYGGVSPSWCYGEASGAGFSLPSAPQNDGPSYSFGHEWYQVGHPAGRQNFRPPQQHGRKQRNKKEPEFSHFCDTCDRGFKDQHKYEEHISQHVKCSVPDCNFMAHEKLVSIHWKNNHAPGIKRIKLDTPEEIAKWREERRRNYPTLQNIEKKKKIMEVREQTGSVLETAQFGRMRGRGRGRGRGWGNRGFQGRHSQGPHQKESSFTEPPKPVNNPPRDEDPLGALVSTDLDLDKEDPTPETRTSSLVVAPKQMSSALGSLMANYGSMSESESDEEPEAAPIQRAKELIQENILNRVKPASGGAETSTKTEKDPNSGPNMFNNRRGHRSRGGRGGRGRRHQDIQQKRHPTLLEMLLAPDIRHERNVLLQCVRYVVRSDFFGLESKPPDRQKIRSSPATTAVQEEESPGGTSEKLSCLSLPKGEGRTVKPETENLQDEGTSKADVMEDQGLQSDCMCSDTSSRPPLESVISSDGPVADSVQNKECPKETTDTTLKNTSASNMYDDEIWESHEAVL